MSVFSALEGFLKILLKYFLTLFQYIHTYIHTYIQQTHCISTEGSDFRVHVNRTMAKKEEEKRKKEKKCREKDSE